jgi:hypothetical protein
VIHPDMEIWIFEFLLHVEGCYNGMLIY